MLNGNGILKKSNLGVGSHAVPSMPEQPHVSPNQKSVSFAMPETVLEYYDDSNFEADMEELSVQRSFASDEVAVNATKDGVGSETVAGKVGDSVSSAKVDDTDLGDKQKTIGAYQIGTKQWRYYDFGPKVVPPLICLPGTAGTADVYYKQIMALSIKGYRVISVDIPCVWNSLEWVQAFEKFLDVIDVHHLLM
ncbi:hypothetical protein SSX86_030083 [Deinandra increscens subsp. villosa]|uniref:Uncharacterized protein n=1 Tax=Deinandra increscens subsp. villosa TaxID=3103831 RepID=A0AAP0CAU1_9ASTR